jgi:uncharacterized membrane protein
VVGVALAIALGVALPSLDALLEASGGRHPLTSSFGGGPAAARDLLAAIAGSLISVTGLTFSLTVVALQLGSSQYSPRLLQTFVTDRVVQLTLAQLVATFVYALTVLRTVRTEDATSGETAFVPRLSITVGYVLTLGSVVALLLFLGHLARSLRVETMLRDVHDEGSRTIDRELPEDEAPHRSDAGASPPGAGSPVAARSSGFVVDVDEARLVEAARMTDVVVRLHPRIGDSVVEGVPAATAWPRRPGGEVDTDVLGEALTEGMRLGFERSPDRDVAYSLRKVVDIASRALSPGVNDPTTAVHALSHASALLGDMVTRPQPTTARTDDDGVTRLLVSRWEPEDLLALVVEEPLHFGGGQPTVLRRLAALLREVAWRAPRGLLDEPLRIRARELADLAAGTTRIGEEERRRWVARVDEALAGDWPDPGR